MPIDPGTGKPPGGMTRWRALVSGMLATFILGVVAPVFADGPPAKKPSGPQSAGRGLPHDDASHPAATGWQPDSEATGRFLRGHLMPRFERQFGQLGQYRWTAQENQASPENALREQVTEAARRGFERATQRAIEDYLIEETALRFLVRSLDRRSHQPASEGSRQGRPAAVRWGVGLSGGLPELELRTRFGSTQVRFELAADGELGIGYRSPRSGRADVFARFEPSESRYSLNTRFSY